ncbi:MAG: sigma-70 family RNA polymerase sigma factor [Elusimicrobiaceae bacterium]|nr:sigma-70 family RNA polymerase sigma factor [Elusimicrobiaceae bacterium]
MENEILDSINEYFKHLAKVTREIDREEVMALWKKVKKGDKNAKNKMMELNLRLVIPTAKRFQRPGMDLMDLIEEGNLGLMQAIEKFEPAKGYRFSTYAIYWIEQYIRKYIEEQSGSIKIPSHAWGNLKRWFKAWNNLKEENGRDPSLREMAQELGLTAKQVKAIMDTLSAATGVESLTSLVGGEDEMTLEDVLSDDGKGNPHDVFLRSENAQVLQQSLMNLQDRDREILTLRFGLADNEPKTLGEVADKMGLSRERVRQLEERAVEQLRIDAQRAGLLEYGNADRRTRKLHAGMVLAHQKTNILGEIVIGGPLGRLLRKQAAKGVVAATSAGQKAGKTSAGKSKKAARKTRVSKGISKKSKRK